MYHAASEQSTCEVGKMGTREDLSASDDDRVRAPLKQQVSRGAPGMQGLVPI